MISFVPINTSLQQIYIVMRRTQQQTFILFTALLFLLPLARSLITQKQSAPPQKQSSSPDQAFAPNVVTSCNVLNLQTAYNYSGIVGGGYLSVPGKGNSALAYTFYGKKDVTSTAQLKNFPTVLWLGGGPGASSQQGNLQQLGPLLLIRKFDVQVIQNNYTWASNYNLLFIDQPVGTGLSYIDNANRYAKTLDEVAADLYQALRELYKGKGCFSMEFEIPPSSPLVIFGQDYGGKYAAAIAKKITEAKETGGFLTGLKGIAIGSGWLNPYEILSQVGTYAYTLGLLDFQQREKVEKLLLTATRHSMDGNWDELHTTYNNVYDYLRVHTEVNANDIRIDEQYEQLLRPYFQNQNIASALYGFNKEVKYDTNSDNVAASLFSDYMKPQSQRVEYLLNKGMPVLVYNGQDDLLVPPLGAMKWLDGLEHPTAVDFRKLLFSPWKINDQVVGAMKTTGMLQLRIFFNSGHQVGRDRPAQAFDMAASFITRITR